MSPALAGRFFTASVTWETQPLSNYFIHLWCFIFQKKKILAWFLKVQVKLKELGMHEVLKKYRDPMEINIFRL